MGTIPVLVEIGAMRRWVRASQGRGERVGLVPTMGALHDGHATLVREAARQCDVVVVSVFVNPSQFNQTLDLETYPRTLDADVALCAAAGAAAVFAPTVREMYPRGTAVGLAGLTSVRVDALSRHLCGSDRPGHFDGVCGVVAKLFHIVPADVAYFGQKDFQQSAIIRQMVADLDFEIDIAVVPTVREADGLAMSSRNRRLSVQGRQTASGLHRALQAIADSFEAGVRSVGQLKAAAHDVLRGYPLLTPAYLDICQQVDLTPLPETATLAPQVDHVAAAAGWVDSVRLIDNVLLPAV